MITLGNKVKDKVSAFTGIVTARHEFLNGCVRYTVTPKVDKKGELREEKWFDEQQLEVVGDGVAIKPRKTGGPTTCSPPKGLRG